MTKKPLSALVNRIPFANEVTAETLRQMEGHLANTMRLFPIEVEFDALGYACTSGAFNIGTDKIAELVSESRPCYAVTNPLTAAVAAMKSVDAKNIAYLGPYSEKVCAEMINYFESEDIEVSASAYYDETEDRFVGRISPSSIQRDSITLAKNNPQIDAIFIACTNLKCAHIIPEIEAHTGIFALSSNQVLAWDLASTVGVKLGSDKGRLFS
jgi:maleate isomerase